MSGCAERCPILRSTTRYLRKLCGEPQTGAAKVLSPSRKRIAVDHVVEGLGVSERRACRVIGQHRSTQRKPCSLRDDEEALTTAKT